MSEDNDIVKELELIQNIIDRQAENSFRIKGWTVTLVVVALLFRTDNFQLLVAFVPLIAFWGLDAYYLRVERQYRALYEKVRKSPGEDNRERFKMDPSEFESEVDNVLSLMFTNSVLWFYGAILMLLLIYTVLSFSSQGQSPAGNTSQTRQLLSIIQIALT